MVNVYITSLLVIFLLALIVIGVHRVAEKGGRVGGENDAAREAGRKFFRN